MGASRLERAKPHGGSPGQENYSCQHAGLFAGGLRGTGRGARTWRLNTGPPMGSRKWIGATRQERAEPHGQFTGIDDFIARATSTEVPRGRHRGRQHANHTGFGMAVLNCTQKDKNRPFWTLPSGLKRAACHVLRLLPFFNSGPPEPPAALSPPPPPASVVHAASGWTSREFADRPLLGLPRSSQPPRVEKDPRWPLALLVYCVGVMSRLVEQPLTCILKYTCQVAVCEAESLVSKYTCFDC
jgi:hypothetical protein